MTNTNDYSDLTTLFQEEDRALDAAPFVGAVMKRVKRRERMRRLVLLSVGSVGALIAGLQLPGLLTSWVGADIGITEAIARAQSDIGETATTNPMWLLVAGMVTLSVFAVSAMERG